MSTPTILSVKALPGLDSPIVQRAQNHIEPAVPGENGGSRSPHRIHASRMEDHWIWAHLLRAVSGWTVIAAGTFPLADFADGTAVCAEITRRWLGESGDGYEELSQDAFLQRGTIAHIRREDDPSQGYCGSTGGPAVFSTSEPNHVEQHCIDCDRRYRAAHYGRVAVTH